MSVLDLPHWWYWKRVLMEVENKDNKSYLFRFTEIQAFCQKPLQSLQKIVSAANESRARRVYLNVPFSHIYFSRRESECLYGLSQGCSLRQVADNLQLSVRTIEYYVKNMKRKLGCNSRTELVSLVIENGFCRQYCRQASLGESGD